MCKIWWKNSSRFFFWLNNNLFNFRLYLTLVTWTRSEYSTTSKWYLKQRPLGPNFENWLFSDRTLLSTIQRTGLYEFRKQRNHDRKQGGSIANNINNFSFFMIQKDLFANKIAKCYVIKKFNYKVKDNSKMF